MSKSLIPARPRIVEAAPSVIPYTVREPECPICHGAGFLRTRGPYQGKTAIVKCIACSDGVNARYQADLVKRLFRGDHFPWQSQHWTFDSYPSDADQEALHEVKAWVLRHLNGDPTSKRGLYIAGAAGRCKTSLAISALKTVLGCGQVGLFVLTLEVMKRLQDSFSKTSEDTEDELLRAITSVPWLVLDDLAVEYPTPYVLTQFYYIIEKRRSAGLYTIFTSNLSPSDLERYWRPKQLQSLEVEHAGVIPFHAGVRIVERLREYCQGIGVNRDNGRAK